MNISVIMPCYLGKYHGAASNREEKFIRAVDSFLSQGVGELIIVSDGCEVTNKIVHDEFSDKKSIRLVKIDKQTTMSGKVRQAGLAVASPDWVTYLDSDDEFGDGHLLAILSGIKANPDKDWLFWNDYVGSTLRKCEVALCRIGTSCIAHKKSIPAVWPDGYMHVWHFITQLGSNYAKIDGPRYIVHHIPGKLDQ